MNLCVGTSATNLTLPSDVNTAIDTNSNTDGYHTFRVAQLPNAYDSYDVWRDGVLIGNQVSLGYYYDSTECHNYLGVAGSLYDGSMLVDYVRMQPGGAWGPVPTPEPSSIVLLALRWSACSATHGANGSSSGISCGG